MTIPEQVYRSIVDQCATGLIIQAAEQVLYANRAALDCLGYAEAAEIQGRPIRELFDAASFDTLAPNLKKLGPEDDQLFIGDLKLCRKSGEQIDAEIYHAGIQIGGDEPAISALSMINFRDVTQTKRLELELRQAQKLESIGRLAAGIAHEINTPIQFIGDSAHYLAEALKDLMGLLDKSRAELGALRVERDGKRALDELAEEDAAADLDYMRAEAPRSAASILDGVSRVSRIVAAMKSFSHPGAEAAIPMDINRMVRDTLVVAAHELKNTIEVSTELADLPQVTGYPAELNQALLNLVINAAHAIADRRLASQPGAIHIRTAADQDAVAISISDNGCGIPSHVQARLFEPFFTTKEVGRGSGQGLAIVRGVAQKHGGTVDFESAVDLGTTFVLRLPLAPPRLLTRPASAQPPIAPRG
jgi:PAS domain S-box-containing protein